MSKATSRVFLILVLLILPTCLTAQTGNGTTKQKSKSPDSWLDDKIAVRTEKPFISKDGSLVLDYTLTNRTGSDLSVCRETRYGGIVQNCLSPKVEEAKLFKRMKDSGRLDEISESDLSVSFFETTLPAEMPVRFVIAFSLPKQELEWTPKVRQENKTQFSLNGELCHGNVSTEVHAGVQGSRRPAVGIGGIDRRSGACL